MQAYEVCIHHFDMFRFLTGSNVKSLYADWLEPQVGLTHGPESFFVNLEFENGAHILFSNHMSSVGAPTGVPGQLAGPVQPRTGHLARPRGPQALPRLRPSGRHPQRRRERLPRLRPGRRPRRAAQGPRRAAFHPAHSGGQPLQSGHSHPPCSSPRKSTAWWRCPS